MNNEHPCHVTGTESLPSSVYDRDSLLICRGTPSEIVLQLVSSPSQLTVREALKVLVDQLASKMGLYVELPWGAPDDILSNLILQVLIGNGIVAITPLS